MKKLKLKLEGIAKEVLTSDQMKKINGGYGDGGSCGSYCIANHTCDYSCPYCYFYPGEFPDWYCAQTIWG